MAFTRAQLLQVGTASTTGAVQVGAGLSVDANGLLTNTGGGGGGTPTANPTPAGTTGPTTGAGTSVTPFVLSAASIVSGSSAQSNETITFTGLTPGDLVTFVDINAGINGSRFNQPTGLVDGSGSYSFRVQYTDSPATTTSTTYTGLLKSGNQTVYISWPVTVGGQPFPSTTINFPTTTDGTATSQPWADGTKNLSATGCLEFSLNGGATFTQGPATINNGVALVTRWAPTVGCALTSGGTISGSITDGFNINTGSITIDRVPNSFTIPDQTGVLVNSTVTSTSVIPLGYNATTYMTLDPTTTLGNMQVSVNGGTYQTIPLSNNPTAQFDVPIDPGDSFTVRGQVGAATTISYYAIVKLGNGVSSVQDTWNISAITSGIAQPTITKIVATDSNQYDAPTDPTYATSSIPGYLTSTATGLDPNVVSSALPIVGGSGSGCTVKVATNASGGVAYVEIVTPGTNYVNASSVTIDCSTIGGTFTEPFTLYTNPVVGNPTTITLTDFQANNAGTFSYLEIQTDSTPDFTTPFQQLIYNPGPNFTFSSPDTSPGEFFYLRARYFSTLAFNSPWSATVKLLSGLQILVNWTIRNSYATNNLNGYDSGNVYFSPEPGSYLMRDYGLGCPALYLLKRSGTFLRVGSVGPTGNVLSYAITVAGTGLINSLVGTAQTFTTVSGIGSGFQAFVSQVSATGLTTVGSIANAGTGYNTGDILSFTSPFGTAVPNDLDPRNDLIIQGKGAPGTDSTGGNPAPPAPPPSWTGSGNGIIYCQNGIAPDGMRGCNSGDEVVPAGYTGGNGWPGGGNGGVRCCNSGSGCNPNSSNPGASVINTTYVTAGFATSAYNAAVAGIAITVAGVSYGVGTSTIVIDLNQSLT